MKDWVTLKDSVAANRSPRNGQRKTVQSHLTMLLERTRWKTLLKDLEIAWVINKTESHDPNWWSFQLIKKYILFWYEHNCYKITVVSERVAFLIEMNWSVWSFLKMFNYRRRRRSKDNWSNYNSLELCSGFRIRATSAFVSKAICFNLFIYIFFFLNT